MSWRPALTGAVVVIVTGFAVGLAVGGDGGAGSETRTVTVRTSAGSRSATRQGSSGSRVQYLASNSKPQTDNLDVLDTPASVRLGRRSYPNVVVLGDIFLTDCLSNATIEYPVDPGMKRFTGTLGWTIDSDSSASVSMEIRVNRPEGPLLYRHVFAGPASAHVSADLGDAAKVVFVFLVPSDGCSGNASLDEERFALGDARFVG